MMVNSDQSGCSGARRDDELLNLRLSNVRETQKRIERLFGLMYLLFLLVMLTWYNINFEGSPLERDIERVEKALTIEMLRPWDNFLRRTASCFHSYFFGYSKNGVVTQSDLKGYIEYYESENKKQADLISLGLQRPWPVDKMKDLLDSEEQWQNCAFWARQDTLVSFLFSLHLYLERYWIERLSAYYDRSIEKFWAETDSVNAVVDSVLVSLAAKVDSLRKPLERPVTFGMHPIVSGLRNRATIWGENWSFNEYTRFDLNELLSTLQKLNHVSWFKKEVTKHRAILLRVQGDLDSILRRTTKPDSLRFFREKTGIQFHELSTILSSRLFTPDDLPDSLQLPHLCSLAYGHLAATTIGDTLLEVYFPTYPQVLEEFNIDKVSGVKTLKNILVLQRGNAKQRIQLLGAEISSRSIFYFLPTICLALYLLAVLLMRHLCVLIRSGQDELWEKSHATTLPIEALKAPLLFTISLNWFGVFLILLPGFGTVGVLIDQMILAGGRGIVLNSYVVWLLTVSHVFVLIFVFKNARLLQKLAKGTGLHFPEILKDEQKSGTQKHAQGDDSSNPK
jgi:hypothetical protein